MKKMLAKRLAQCLNPDLNVIHLLTIEVYAHIFAREHVSKEILSPISLKTLQSVFNSPVLVLLLMTFELA